MQQKKYIIAGKNFYMKEYGDLTGLEEEKINSILFTGKTDDVFNIKLSGYELFSIILIPEDNRVDVNAFEWKNIKNKQAAEILVDFIVEKKTSQDSMLNYMKELTGQRLLQYSTMKENSGSVKPTGGENS
jgi:hypothetical protein